MSTSARGKSGGAKVSVLRAKPSSPPRPGSALSRNAEAGVPDELVASPLYGVAMLKIAMELKKADARPLDELIAGVLTRMGLPESEFRAFLSANGGLLRTIASKRSY